MFSPHAWSGNLGRRDLAESYDGGLNDEMLLIKKFYKKYPEVKYMPISGPIWNEHGGQMKMAHPASEFVQKQKNYMK